MEENTSNFPAGVESSSAPGSDGNPFAGGMASGMSDGSAGQGPGGIGSSRDSFSGMETDFGENNTDNGTGNWFFGDSNQAEGSGNWSYGGGNQTNGNGNWYLSGADSSPFNSVFAGENNPLTGGNPFGFGEGNSGEGDAPPVSLDSVGGNNPVFAGGSTTATPVGDGEVPESAENPTGNNNMTTGNGNWYFGDGNETNGNGNWFFGSGGSSNGNANWNLGDNNQVSGNGNRPSGSDNAVSGNSNRISGSGNSVTGNRFDLGESGVSVYGNADRYFLTDGDGNVTLVSDESATDSNYDFSGVVGYSGGSEPDALLDGGDSVNVMPESEMASQLDESLIGAGSGPLPNAGEDPMGGAAGTFLAGRVPEGLTPMELAVA